LWGEVKRNRGGDDLGLEIKTPALGPALPGAR